MYMISILLVAFVIGSVYVITSSMMYEPPEADDDGGEGLHPMPPTFSGPTGSVRHDGQPTEEVEKVLS
jgi:hypothetical protein